MVMGSLSISIPNRILKIGSKVFSIEAMDGPIIFIPFIRDISASIVDIMAIRNREITPE